MTCRRWSVLIALLVVMVLAPGTSSAFTDAQSPQPSQPSSGSALTDEQKAAAANALKALRKLKSATEVGVSLEAYQERLIDTKSEVDEHVRSLPLGILRARIREAMGDFLDASTVWNEGVRYRYKFSLRKAQTGRIVAKHKLRLKGYGEIEVAELRSLVGSIWLIAANEIDLAEAALKNAESAKPEEKSGEDKASSGS